MTLKLDIWPTEHSIVPYGEDVLRQTARPVRRINSRIRKLIDRLSEVMYAANGLGLAAPQLGESVRVVVLDAGDGLITWGRWSEPTACALRRWTETDAASGWRERAF